jgi:hypothetical protein
MRESSRRDQSVQSVKSLRIAARQGTFMPDINRHLRDDAQSKQGDGFA